MEDNIIQDYLDLFNEVFSINMDFDVFKNKHFENPNVMEIPFEAKRIDGEIAGINAFLGLKYKYMDSERLVAQSCDTAVGKRYRGKGIFSSLIKTKMDRADAFLLFGLPNENSYPGFIKLGWEKVCVLHTYTKIIPFGTNLSRIKEKISVKISDKPFFSLEEQQLVNDYVRNGFIRTNKDLEWKLKYRDSKLAKFYINCSFIGYIIYDIGDSHGFKKIDIHDWNFISEEKRILSKCIYALGIFLEESIRLVNVPFINPTSESAVELHNNKFFSRKLLRENGQILIASNLNRAPEFSNVDIKSFDTDLFLNC